MNNQNPGSSNQSSKPPINKVVWSTPTTGTGTNYFTQNRIPQPKTVQPTSKDVGTINYAVLTNSTPAYNMGINSSGQNTNVSQQNRQNFQNARSTGSDTKYFTQNQIPQPKIVQPTSKDGGTINYPVLTNPTPVYNMGMNSFGQNTNVSQQNQQNFQNARNGGSGTNYFIQNRIPQPKTVQPTSKDVGTINYAVLTNPTPLYNMDMNSFGQNTNVSQQNRQNFQNARNTGSGINYFTQNQTSQTQNVQPTSKGVGSINYPFLANPTPVYNMGMKSFGQNANVSQQNRQIFQNDNTANNLNTKLGVATKSQRDNNQNQTDPNLQVLKRPMAQPFLFFDIDLLPISFQDDSNSIEFPTGIETLIGTKHIFIQPKSLSIGIEDGYSLTRRKYEILNTYGERLFIAAEEIDNHKSFGCGFKNKLNLKILRSNGSEFLKIKGKSKTTVAVQVSNSQFICSIKEITSFCSDSYFQIKNTSGKVIYKICRDYRTRNSYDFVVLTGDGTMIGKVSKTWIGLPRSDQTLAHSYGISFPKEISLVDKTCLLVAEILLYFKYIVDRNRELRQTECGGMFLVLCLLNLTVFLLVLGLLAAYSYRKWLK